MIQKGFRVEMAAEPRCGESPHKNRMSRYKSKTCSATVQSRPKTPQAQSLAQWLQNDMRDMECWRLARRT
jgi:hypothetical protein